MSDPSDTRRLSVLVVDDHRISREYTAAVLRGMGATVRQAASADAALRSALRDPPGLICVDLHLAGASGLDLIARIRDSWPAGRPYPRVWVLSAEPPSPDPVSTARQGVEGFLTKPVEPGRLRALIPSPSSEPRSPQGLPEDDAGLDRLFREELRTRLTELDGRISIGDRAGAEAILHQLIASSGFCGERGLESELRALLAACRDRYSLAGLARRYYSVWATAGGYLASGGRVGTG